MITRRQFDTVVRDIQRDITGADSAVDARDKMLKNDFGTPRAASIITTWLKRVPSQDEAERCDRMGYVGEREKFIYEGGGDIVVNVVGFDGESVILYNRYGTPANALEKHIEFVNLFAAGVL